jgi:hypothetical protein
MAITIAVSIDGADIGRLAQFWAEVLDQPVNPGATNNFAAITTRDGLRLCSTKSQKAKSSRTASTPTSPPPTTRPRRTG